MAAGRPSLASPTELLAAAAAEERNLLEPEVYALLEGVGIAVPRHAVVGGPDEIHPALCARFECDEIVVKVLAPELLHKSSLGGVVSCACEAGRLQAACAEVMSAPGRAGLALAPRGALLAERVPHRSGLGWEVLLGLRHDPAFGPLVVVGAGGLDSEALMASLTPARARAVRPASGLGEAAARDMLRGTLVRDALCGGLRGQRPALVDEEQLVAAVVAFARLAEWLAGFDPPGGVGLAELEVNPLVAALDGRLVALDGVARLQRPAPLAPARPLGALRHMLQPRSALVVGASAEQANPGRVILRNLVAGGGVPPSRIYALHPTAAEIEGCRALATPAELPEAVDLAVVAVPKERAEAVLTNLVQNRWARSVTLITGGLGETEGGREAEERLRAIVGESHRAPDGGVLVNGGNCLGIVSAPGRYSTFFIPPHKLPSLEAPAQNLASVSQSGAYLVSQISNLAGLVQPRYAISFGNQVDVTLCDWLEHLAGDPAVRVFAAYLEGFARGDGERLLELGRRFAREGRPLLLYKSGRTPEGGGAAASHTAAAVGDYDVCRELLREAGVIECASLDELEDAIVTFCFLAGRQRAPRQVAVLSNAGFECTVAADGLHGLRLAPLAPATRARLTELLPAGVIDVRNPVDATPMTTTARYAGCLRVLLDDPAVEAVVVAGVPATPALESLAADAGHAEDVTRAASLPSELVRLFRDTDKPVVFSVDSGALYDACATQMRRAGLPTFRKVDRAMRALATWAFSLPPDRALPS